MSLALVTGGAGFIGSHLIEALLREGIETHVLDNLATGRKENVPGGAELHVADVRKPPDWLLKKLQPETIFHLAAQADVRVSVREPRFDADVNVGGTIELLEAARAVGARIILASTGGAIYGECERAAREDDPREPLAPYGTSKLCAEEYVLTYNRLYGGAHSVLRLANVYGPRQDPHGEAGVVAIFLARLERGEPCVVFGNGQQTRDYVYVEDVAAAFLAAAAGPLGIFNVGTSAETSVLQVLAGCARAAGVDVEPVHAEPRLGELQRSFLDASRAAKELAWTPKTDLDSGLASTVAWVRTTSDVLA